MGQEFIIKSTALEDKINQLLPSHGGTGAGVDLSASTTIIPIVDLTECAEGSDVRIDLQTALSHDSITSFNISNATTTIVNTTGYFNGAWFFEGTNIIVEDNIPEMAASEEDRTITFTVYDGDVDFTTEDDGFTDSYKLAEGSMIVNRGGARIAAIMWKIEGDILNSTPQNTCSPQVSDMVQINVWLEEWNGPEPSAESNNTILDLGIGNRVWLSSSGNDVSNYLHDGFYKYVDGQIEDLATDETTDVYNVIEIVDGLIVSDQQC